VSRSSLNHLTEESPTGLEAIELLGQLRRQSDRECAVVCVSLLEHQLEVLLLNCFVEMTSAEEKELFGGTAPLSTFAAKIKVAYALRLIDKTFRDDLDRVRKIRNVFAHKVKPIHFSHPDVADWCFKLKLAQSPRPKDMVANDIGSRAKFAYVSAIQMLWLWFQGSLTGWPVRWATRSDAARDPPSQEQQVDLGMYS
jgi:DNA-binding MltR family transcriptional regulator